MADEHRLTIQFEGLQTESGDVRLDTFAEELARFQRALRTSHQIVSEQQVRGLIYRVVALSHDSPATVVVEATGPEARAVGAHSYLLNGLASLRRGEVEGLDPDFLDAIEGITRGVGNSYSRIVVSNSDFSAVAIDQEMSKALREVEANEISSWGTVKGHVERWNSHSRPFYFSLYPVIGGSVRCEFGEELLEDARTAVERSASVTGRMWYRPGHRRPYRCEVEHIDVHDRNEDLPELTIAQFPGITGDLSVTEYIQELRDAWD